MIHNQRRVTILALAAALLLAGCDLLEPAPPPPPPRVTPIAVPTATPLPVVVVPTPTPRPVATRLTQPVVRGTFVKAVEAPGTLAPAKQLPVYARSGGVLAELRVKVGDQVAKGDVVGVVQTADAELVVAKAEASLADNRLRLAELQYKQAQLKSDPPRVQDQIDDAQYALDQASLELRKAQGRNFDRELQIAERQLKWARDNASIRQWWYQRTMEAPTREDDRVQAATDAAQAVEALDAAEQAYEDLKAARDFWPEELVLKERRVKNLQKRLDDARTQATVTTDLYNLQLGLLAKQIAEAQVTMAKGNEAVAKAAQVNELLAPADGMVTAVSVEVGDLVQPNTPLLTVADPKVERAVVSVPETNVASLSLGQAVQVEVPALGGQFPGKISWIALTASRDKDNRQTYQVAISLEYIDQRAKLGMTANADIAVLKKDDVLLVPSTAVRTRGDKRYVEVVDGDRTAEVEVETGLRNDAETEIAVGLREGQLVSLGPRLSVDLGTGVPPQPQPVGSRGTNGN